MEYFFMVIIAIVVFPLVFLAAVKIRRNMEGGRKFVFLLLSVLILCAIFILIPLVTSQKIFFNYAGLGFFISSIVGLILGLGGPYSFKK